MNAQTSACVGGWKVLVVSFFGDGDGDGLSPDIALTFALTFA
jgi:hypothetical protein